MQDTNPAHRNQRYNPSRDTMNDPPLQRRMDHPKKNRHLRKQLDKADNSVNLEQHIEQYESARAEDVSDRDEEEVNALLLDLQESDDEPTNSEIRTAREVFIFVIPPSTHKPMRTEDMAAEGIKMSIFGHRDPRLFQPVRSSADLQKWVWIDLGSASERRRIIMLE
ncbi:hypothetical protein BDZ89DRAFT_394017 [Hymenopellis radicata]|nr:hypothetical protein BDZ89DRAFT_394017 [Hymenopellis radicata]